MAKPEAPCIENAENELFEASGAVSYWLTNSPQTMRDYELMGQSHARLKRAAISYAVAILVEAEAV